MTNPTLERAARAAALSFYETEALDEPCFFESFGGRSPAQLAEQFWREFIPEARAVLMAVKEIPDGFIRERREMFHSTEFLEYDFATLVEAILADGGE